MEEHGLLSPVDILDNPLLYVDVDDWMLRLVEQGADRMRGQQISEKHNKSPVARHVEMCAT